MPICAPPCEATLIGCYEDKIYIKYYCNLVLAHAGPHIDDISNYVHLDLYVPFFWSIDYG